MIIIIMNRQTKWTWASHDFVLMKYCREGNSHDAMFRCCGGALASGNACVVQNGRSSCDGLEPFTSLQRRKKLRQRYVRFKKLSRQV